MTMAAFTLDDAVPTMHVTVLADEAVRGLGAERGGLFVDATAGGGGHSERILEASPLARVIACDRDPGAVDAARKRLLPFGDRAVVVQASFAELERELAALGVSEADGVLADLGVSSFQLDDPERGMSFRSRGPLDMRMDKTSGRTARDLIERLSQDELADLIYQLGEERRSRRVARCIKQALAAGELADTFDLRRAVVRAVGPRRVGGVDPATRTFQALRIAVNEELEQLGTLLSTLERLVRPGGIAAVISFHSLEDRLVKREFQKREIWRRLSPKPLTPGPVELAKNPRSRSAKLRAAERLESPA
jgi:16S rRNA (cytosine1402-N4)-methyltransferase